MAHLIIEMHRRDDWELRAEGPFNGTVAEAAACLPGKRAKEAPSARCSVTRNRERTDAAPGRTSGSMTAGESLERHAVWRMTVSR
jgi:hypothetical protein